MFQRDAIQVFRFVRSTFDADTGVARLVYAFDDGPELVETVTVPGAPFVLDDARTAAAQRALRLLHLIAGVSYYKAAVPPGIRIDDDAIDADTAALLETVYVNGLGEFAYRNGLDLHGRIRFPHGGPSPRPAPAGGRGGESAAGESPLPPAGEGQGEGECAPTLGLRRHALVAIGG
ncbi:MAG TPA: endonuclease domain-containing protein, partial [Xanthomonadaceae bacterium]|nr:endonuclease domain-containing protein [Xanthomonadaceae bacterium]